MTCYVSTTLASLSSKLSNPSGIHSLVSPPTSPLKDQIPNHQKYTQTTARIKHHPRGTLPLRRALQLLISPTYVLRCVDRIHGQKVDIGGLNVKVLSQCVLEFGDFVHGTLGGSVGRLGGLYEMRKEVR